MDDMLTDDEFSQWFSTYGLITAERILGHYQINLPQKELLTAIKYPTSFYHKLIQVPLKNVLNGIILQQANDYHIYAQKLFIDYLLSGESGKPPEAQGASIRENLEDERKNLVALGEQFNQQQLDHESFINSSQKTFIQISKQLREQLDSGISLVHRLLRKEKSDITMKLTKDSLIHALIYVGFSVNNPQKDTYIDSMSEALKIKIDDSLKKQLIEQLSSFFDVLVNADSTINQLMSHVADISSAARSYRTRFYESVLRVVELINLLPEYRINPAQDAVNRESLYFDNTIGEA